MRREREYVGWLIAYAAMMGTVVYALVQSRHWALAQLSSPSATSGWQDWREAVERSRNDPSAPVLLREVNSREPPMLVLLRDYFAAILASVLLIATFLFAFMALTLRGVLRPASQGQGTVDPRRGDHASRPADAAKPHDADRPPTGT